MEKLLIVGLGNPGKKFEYTRHNIGVRVVQAWAAGPGREQSHLYMLPIEYMNNSGKAVQAAMKRYGVKKEQLLLVHDDLETPFGEVRVRESGSAKGHNGVRSIQEQFDTQDIPRILIGVGRPPQGWQTDKFVLARFTSEEESHIEKTIIPKAVEEIETYCIKKSTL